MYDFPAKYDLDDPPPNEQMILKNASALIYVINPQLDTVESLDTFERIYEYMKERNSNNCHFSIFVNKSDIQLQNLDARDDFHLKHKKKLSDDKIDVKQVDFHFTSIYNYSIFEAMSKVVQKIISCSRDLCKLLNTLANYCKI